MSGDASAEKQSKTDGLTDLSILSVKEVLTNDADYKCAFIHAVDAEGQSAVILLNKKPFPADCFSKVISAETKLHRHAQNDIYGNFDFHVPQDLGAVKATVIYPATKQHVDKYREQDLLRIDESAEDYANITVPYIKESSFDLSWVYNFLEKKKEADRIICEDADPVNGFLLAPDLKWDGKSVENLYVTAIINRRDIRSIRDLTADHLPLLENVREKSLSAIQRKYGVAASHVLSYFHYQPSYYHLHVHFINIKYHPPGSGVSKAHLLSEVIENIKMKSDAYQVKTISCVLKANDKLLAKFREHGKV